MRLIHSNPMCRDIAIWYDEFLTPGENFNSAIRQALEKSDLFALAVTPNLINELNYILSTEYPMARELNKEILPAELLPTDREKLREMYEGIPEPVSADDRERLTERLLESVRELALLSNDSDPQHNFFIGLAYLSGIDVEVDHERAVKLITGSAEAGCIPAIEKLVSMYNTGEGVKRDQRKSAALLERSVKLRKEIFEAQPNETAAEALINDIESLGRIYYDLRMLEQAGVLYSGFLEYIEEHMTCDTVPRRDRYDADMLLLLGEITEASGDIKAALAYYEEGMKRFEQLAAAEDSILLKRRLAGSYNRVGQMMADFGDFEKAEQYFRAMIGLLDQMTSETQDTDVRRDRYMAYRFLGDLMQKKRELHQAKLYYYKSCELTEELAKETGYLTEWQNAGRIHREIARNALDREDLRSAAHHIVIALKILSKIVEKTQELSIRADLGACYFLCGELARATDHPEKAEGFYLKSVNIYEDLFREAQTIEFLSALGTAYELYGQVAKDIAAAEEALKKCLAIRKEIWDKTKTPDAYRALGYSYEMLGYIALRKGDPHQEYAFYKKFFEISAELAQSTGSAQDLDNSASAHFLIGFRFGLSGHLTEAQRIWRLLYESHPDNPKYLEKLQLAEEELNKLSEQDK